MDLDWAVTLGAEMRLILGYLEYIFWEAVDGSNVGHTEKDKQIRVGSIEAREQESKSKTANGMENEGETTLSKSQVFWNCCNSKKKKDNFHPLLEN